MTPVRFMQVDVFTDIPLAGNPAASGELRVG